MDNMQKIAIYTNSSGCAHDTGLGHPEQPDRLATLLALFNEKPFCDLPQIEAREAEIEWIRRIHPMDYIDRLQEAMPDRGLGYIDGDTVVSPGTWQAALDAAGTVCRAVEDVLRGTRKQAFCAVRPPGHHAEPAQAMGFCFFNNAAIGAKHAQAMGAKRVAIVDFDVHHGNGSDTVARTHEDIFYASTHQHPLFPGTGLEENNIEGRVVNITLPNGSGSEVFRTAYKRRIFPALNSFAPDFLIISAGFDAHKDDPLAGIVLDEDDFSWITQELLTIAQTHGGGKIVSVLEGGYNLVALRSSVKAHLEALFNI